MIILWSSGNMIEKINTRLNKAIENLDKQDFVELFPLILNDLEYILVDFKNDVNALAPGENYKYGFSFTEKKITYFAKLTKIFFEKIFGVDINIIESNEYSFATVGGGYDFRSSNIYYSNFGIMISGKSDLSFLHTFLHEGRHKMQHDFYKSSELLSFPPYMLKLLRENLLINSLQDNNQFYINNYDVLLTENDSEIFAKQEIFNFIRKMTEMYLEKSNKSSKEKVKILIKAKKINKIFYQILTKESFRIDSEVKRQIDGSELIVGSYKMDGQVVDRLIFIDKFIKSNPQLQKDYPILRLLFNGNIPKNYEEIMNDKVNIKKNKSPKEQQKIDELYNEIIMLDPILTLTAILEMGNIQFAKEYLSLYPSIISEYPDEIKYLNEKYGCFSPNIK